MRIFLQCGERKKEEKRKEEGQGRGEENRREKGNKGEVRIYA